ncbi:MFS transporter [Coraliomargarita parva]|uniref:MFS transporter n=1 Tax=Coraliomargarita parva TaxID=3014050 RepID=UPI0022B4F182|nr:MFS transporter [Coraliomargarita parva]
MSELPKAHYHRAKFWQIVAFAGNDTATNASLAMVGTFFVVMMTDNLALSGLVAGLILTLARLFDGVTDPLIGTWIDNTVTRWGKFRPFIFVGAIIINLGMLLIFGGLVHFENDVLQYAWLIACYLLYIVGYTAQTACTKSAQVQLTNDPDQRSTMGFFTSVISSLFWAAFLGFSLNYVKGFEGGFSNPTGYFHVALITVGVNVVFTFFAILALGEHDRPERYAKFEKSEKVKISAVINIIRRNRAMQTLIAAAATNKLASVLQGAAAVYFYIYTVQNLEIQAKIAWLGLPGMFIGNFLAVFIARRFDRKISFLAGTWMAMIFGVVIMVIRPFAPGQTLLFLGLMLMINAATALAQMNVIPMIGDVADYERWKNGRFAPGVVGTTFSLVDKLISSASGLLIGGTLAFIGYESGMEWTPQAYWAFLFVMIGVPVLGHICSIIAYAWYPINRETYHKMYAEMPEEEAAVASTELNVAAMEKS